MQAALSAAAPRKNSTMTNLDTGHGMKSPTALLDSDGNLVAVEEEEMDPDAMLDGWEHDPQKMEVKFACAVLNWKGWLPKKKEWVLKVNAFYKQATVGDAPPIEEKPFDTLAREKWDVWDKWRGTPMDVSKRRYITYLRSIDESLVQAQINEKPPIGFPMTRYKEKICARCNCNAQCMRPLLDENNKPLKGHVLGPNADPKLMEYNALKEWFKKYSKKQKCKWGMHVPLTAPQAQPFQDWFKRPDVMGFAPFEVKPLIPLLKEVLHAQLGILYARQVDYREQQTAKSKKRLHEAHEKLNEQTDRVLGLQFFHREVTGEEYKYECPCLRTNKHCNTRRMAASGMNHTHPLEIMRPEVDYSYYERVVALRQEVLRLGMSASTGVGVSSEQRCSMLAGRIAEFHGRQATVMEAKRNLLYQEWRHPKQKEDVLDFAETHVDHQLDTAIRRGDCANMATLIHRGAKADYETTDGQTAIIKCTQAADRAALKMLVKAGADINYFNKKGLNALSWACKTDSLIMIHELLDLGAAPGLEGPTGLTAAMIAARNDNKYALETICDHVLRNDPAKQLAVDRILNSRSLLKGKTALMLCAQARMAGMCRFLCKMGATTDIPDFGGSNASQIALKAGWNSLGEWLNKTRAIGPNGMQTYSDSANDKKERINGGNLLKAIESGELITGEEGETLGRRLLLGEDINSRARTPASRGNSPEKNSRGGRRRSTKTKPRGASPSSDSSRSPSPSREHPRRKLSKHDKLEAVDASLFAKGSETAITTTATSPPSNSAPSTANTTRVLATPDVGDIERIPLLEVPLYLKIIATGLVPPDAQIEAGTTPLIRAAFEGDVRIVHQLIKHGSDVNFDNKTGQTPLMSAAAGGSLHTAKLLLAKGAKVLQKDEEGMNAIAYASNNGNADMVEFLMSARLLGTKEALRKMDEPTAVEAIDSVKAENAVRTENLLQKYGATPVGADDGDFDSWKWRLPGLVNREYAYDDEGASSDDTDEEEKKANGIGDKGVVKTRCVKCTLIIPCKHYKTFMAMWNDNPKGVGIGWGARPKQERKRGSTRGKNGSRPATSNEGYDWKTQQKEKNTVAVAEKEHEKKMREAFDSMDVNKDGSLTKQEVKTALCYDPEVRKILEIPDTASEEFDSLYDKIDADQSMSVTYDEFHTYFAKQKDDLAQEKRRVVREENFIKQLQGAYKLVDINGDGDVSKQEMLMAIQSNFKIQEMLGNVGGMSKDEFEETYAKIDEDGSDFIDFEEFKKFFIKKKIADMDKSEKEELCHRKAFNLMDVDHSGSLSKTELLLGLRDNPRIQSLMGVPTGGVDSAEFQKIYKQIDADGSDEIDLDEFKEFFIKLERKRRQSMGGRRSRASMSKKGGAKSPKGSESEEERTPKGYGDVSRKKKDTTRSEGAALPEETPTKKKGTRHAHFKNIGKKKKKKDGITLDEWDDGEARDMYGWQGERQDLDIEDKRVMVIRREVKFTGLNCDFGGWRYTMPRCVKCRVGYARMKLMPDDLLLCDRCVLERHWDTGAFCRLVPLYAEKERAKPRPPESETNLVFEEPDEIQLASFYVGQRRYADAERTMSVLLERQAERLENGGADNVAMGFTLRALAGYEEARGRVPFARALRENSLDVFASALGPTNGQVMLALRLYTDTLKKQGYWYETIEFYNSIVLQFQDSKIKDRRDLAAKMLVEVSRCLEGRELDLMGTEDLASKAMREVIMPKRKGPAFMTAVNALLDDGEDDDGEGAAALFMNRDKIPAKFMKKLLTSDDYWNMVGAKDLRHLCKIIGCFNLFKFWMGVAEYRNLRSGEAGFSHTCRRIYREFIQPQDMLEFVDTETREQLGEILETEKRAPPAEMYDELWKIATNVLYEDAFLKFTVSEQGKRWWKDFELMEKHGQKVIKTQAYLRVISAKRLVKVCGWLELSLRKYSEHKAEGEAKFKMWLADRKRLKGLADDLGCSLIEYMAKFAELRPDQFKKWKEGKIIRMNEARSLRKAGNMKDKKPPAAKKKVVKGTYEVQLIVHKCRGLLKADTFGKSDPLVIVKYNNEEIGRTSVINKNLNPDWGKWKINSCLVEGKLGNGGVPEVMGSGGNFTLEVYDMDMGIKLGDFLGEASVSGMIACDDENRIIKEEHELKGKKGAAFSKTIGGSVVYSVKALWVKARELGAPLTFKCTGANGDGVGPGEGPKGGMADNTKGMVGGMMNKLGGIGVPSVFKNKMVMIEPHFNMLLTLHRCKGLAKADMFGKSDPCVVVMYKGKEVGRSSIVNKNLNPEWGTATERGFTGGFLFEPYLQIFSDSDGKLSEDEKDEEITFEVYDADMKMLGDFLGRVSFRAGRLLGMKGTNDAEFQLQQKEGTKKKSKLVQGTIHLSVDTTWDKGGEVEKEGIFSKGKRMTTNAANAAMDHDPDHDPDDFSSLDFSGVGNNVGKNTALDFDALG